MTQTHSVGRSISLCHQQVSMDSSGSFKTARPVDGCFYEFQELSAGQLRISELKGGHSATNHWGPRSYGFPRLQ